MIMHKMIIDFNMFGALIKHVIMDRLNSTPFVTNSQ